MPASEKDRLQYHYDQKSYDDDNELAQRERGSSYPASGAAGPSSAGAESSASASASVPASTPTSAARHHQHQQSTLPPYSAPASSAHEAALEQEQRTMNSSNKAGHQRYPGLPSLDYRLYRPPLFTLSTDKTTIKTTAPYLSATASALASLVRSQATVPPKPMIEITGHHHRVDFSVKLNLMPLLVVPEEGRALHYVRCVSRGEKAMRGGTKPTMEDSRGGSGSGGHGAGTENEAEDALDMWCRRFCEDTSPVKVFVLERQVANLDLHWLEGQIRTLVAATGYRGVVTVSFPVLHARVVVQSPDRVNKFFTTVTSLFTGKSTYEVVKAVWPFATHKNGEPDRVCAVQSEEAWWKEWRDPLRYAICCRRVGYVTNEDRLEVLMEGVGKDITTVNWEIDRS